MIVPTVEIRRKGDASRVLSRIRRALTGPSKVKVGFPAGKAGSDIVSRATWAEFGTVKQPERPFLRTTMADNRASYRNVLRADAKAIVQGKMDMQRALNRLGAAAAGDIQQTIGSNMPPPNAPSTIRQKGSSKTLVDTGAMRAAVTWDIE